MLLSGVFVNGLGVIAGGMAGMILKQGISEKVKTLLMQGLALGVMYVGLSGVFDGHNTVYVIVSLTLGAIIGESINFDRYFHAFGEWIQRKIPVSGETSLAEGFVSCTLFICPGAMAIVGSLECGLGGGCDVLYAKALIDLIFALIMATTLGMGVARVTADGKTRPAACIGGMLSVLDGRVRLLASTFEWAEDIDVERAQRAEAEAKAALEQGQLSGEARDLAEARLRRARVRLSAAGQRTD